MIKKLIKTINDYFTFNKREKNGFLVLSVLLLFILSIRFLFLQFQSPPIITIMELNHSMIENFKKPFHHAKKTKSYLNHNTNTNSSVIKTNGSKQSTNLFDPNFISKSQAIELGFSEKQSQVLLNYRKKGGRFKNPEDLKKLYGMNLGLYHKLEKFIRIDPAIFDSEYSMITNNNSNKPTLEINRADSISLDKLKGIGPALARRIIQKRKLLGGFYSSVQLKEVYGITDSIFEIIRSQISIDSLLINKININETANLNIENHPYLGKKTGKILSNYKSKHGEFKNWEELKKTGLFTDEKIKQLHPYIKFQ